VSQLLLCDAKDDLFEAIEIEGLDPLLDHLMDIEMLAEAMMQLFTHVPDETHDLHFDFRFQRIDDVIGDEGPHQRAETVELIGDQLVDPLM